MKSAFSAYVAWGAFCSLFAHAMYPTDTSSRYEPLYMLAAGFIVLVGVVLWLNCSYFKKVAKETVVENKVKVHPIESAKGSAVEMDKREKEKVQQEIALDVQ